MPSSELAEAERRMLLGLARASIIHGLQHGQPLAVDVNAYPESVRRLGASFVTLQENGELRGCIGTLSPTRPLVTDVAANAFAAAFRDPRFPPLADTELTALEIHVSVLQPAERLSCSSEADLLAQLRPGVDGLILEDQGHRGTFLPSVWESLPEPAEFLRHLKAKAGLPADCWSETLKVWRYTTESFGETD